MRCIRLPLSVDVGEKSELEYLNKKSITNQLAKLQIPQEVLIRILFFSPLFPSLHSFSSTRLPALYESRKLFEIAQLCCPARGNALVAELLLAQGADVNSKSNNEGFTALNMAALKGHMDVA